MKKTISLILSALALISCEKQPLEVTDNSFKFKTEVRSSEETLEYSIYLTLQSGSRTCDYEFLYTIDGNPSLFLLDKDGNTVESGVKVDFRSSNSIHYKLPPLSVGEHIIDITLSSEAYSKQEDYKFSVQLSPFTVHAEVNANKENPNSLLLISLQDGLTDRPYCLTATIDSETFDLPESASEIDFSKTPIYTAHLPQIRPGKHILRLTLDDTFSTKTETIEFDEPIRYPTLDLTLSYNKQSGNHELTISRNPYAIRVRVQAKLIVTGSVNYYASCSNSWTYDEPWTFRTTDTKMNEGEQSIDTDSDGVFCVAERDKVASEITSSYIFSAIYISVGSGEDWYYKVSGYEPVYYKITKEELSIHFEIEDVPGITPVLRNSISGCTVSGIE